jgi:hypothetical protein
MLAHWVPPFWLEAWNREYEDGVLVLCTFSTSMKIRISFKRQVVAPEIRSSHAYLITKVPPNSIVIICSST